MLANLKAILELIKLVVLTWKWAKGQIDDLTYKRAVAKNKDLLETYKSGSKEERLKALKEAGK
jgi:hypothetical protein